MFSDLSRVKDRWKPRDLFANINFNSVFMNPVCKSLLTDLG